jgi:hypothetical protein
MYTKAGLEAAKLGPPKHFRLMAFDNPSIDE